MPNNLRGRNFKYMQQKKLRKGFPASMHNVTQVSRAKDRSRAICEPIRETNSCPLCQPRLDIAILPFLFVPNIFYGVVSAKVGPKRNSARTLDNLTHFARADCKLHKEWFALWARLSGDDMNIIQVPAVWYHPDQEVFILDQGVNHRDFLSQRWD